MRSPCRIPLCGMTSQRFSPWIMIWKLTLLTLWIISCTHMEQNPNLSNIASKKSHSILLYALLISNLIAKSGTLPFFFSLIKWRTSFAMMMLS
ncbi:unnamed protein product [Ilex paraguariensis]|uniref:NADH dehydrogenase subunit 2 n=1 Tax=Ilex paraguariensis TaxID=185542 RepID=A0ABC8SYQ8_9AQUA